MHRKAIILGAGRGVRRLDFTKSYPTALERVDDHRSALDWNLSALEQAGFGRVAFVGGYHIQKIIESHPQVTYFFDPDWQLGGDAGSLRRAVDWLGSECLVVRAELLLTPTAVARLLSVEQPVVLGTCLTRPVWEEGQHPASVVVGLLLRAGAGELRPLIEEVGVRRPGASLSDVADAMSRHVARVDLSEVTAPIQERSRVARLLLSGKAHTLERLRPVLKTAAILDQVRFSVGEWREDRISVLARVRRRYSRGKVVVRSSAALEDGWAASCAGKYASVLGVDAADELALQAAIQRVVDGYDERDLLEPRGNWVFVQEHLGNVRGSGVLFTRDLETGAPYFTASLDRVSQRTDVVTAGKAGALEKHVVLRGREQAVDDPDVRSLLAAALELETLLFHDALDIEFAIDEAGRLCVLQVRPLTTGVRTTESCVADEDVGEELAQAVAFWKQIARPSPGALARQSVLGVMPDWNPAEMIGTVPRRLALSTYQRLIGDRAWATARARIGYRDLTPAPLILSLVGRPYVDVRASLESFLPASLGDTTGRRLVEAQLAKLVHAPTLHDKIEFEVAWTCHALDYDERERELRDWGLSGPERDQLRKSLRSLTDAVLRGVAPRIDGELGATLRLEERRKRVLFDLPDEPAALARAIARLANDCVRFGTEPFAVLARYAFVALAFLRSLARHGVLSASELDQLLRAVPTVGSELAAAFADLRAGVLAREDFLAHFGHLRPSSYDVTSPSYSSAPELYLCIGGGAEPTPAARVPFDVREWWRGKEPAVNRLLEAEGFEARAAQLLDFVVSAIPARELAKFEFTRTLDTLLELAVRWGGHFGLDRDSIAHVSLDDLVRHGSDSASAAARTELKRDVEFAKKRWNVSRAVQLPALVTAGADFDHFAVRESAPNFVTDRRVVAPVCRLDRGGLPAVDGAIVVVESADPGHDWVFARRIVGLVTCYGGAASHMCIRAAEFGLPAAIGCGQLLFERVERAHVLDLDCAARVLRVVR